MLDAFRESISSRTSVNCIRSNQSFLILYQFVFSTRTSIKYMKRIFYSIIASPCKILSTVTGSSNGWHVVFKTLFRRTDSHFQISEDLSLSIFCSVYREACWGSSPVLLAIFFFPLSTKMDIFHSGSAFYLK